MTGESAPKTNVARSNINSASLLRMLESLYYLYLKHINEQKNKLCSEFSVTWVAEETKWMLDSFLLKRNQTSRTEFLDLEILKSKISEMDLLLIEKENNREFCSINKLKGIGHYWTVESEAFESANRLIKEIKSSNKSAMSLLKMLYEDNGAYLDSIDVLLCKHRFFNIVDDVLLSDFQVRTINLVESQRRLDLQWVQSSSSLWIMIPKQKDRYSSNKFYFIQQSDDVSFSSTSYEGIRSIYGIFILKGSKMSQYLLDVLASFDLDKDEDISLATTICSFFEKLFVVVKPVKDWNTQIDKAFDKSNNLAYYEYIFSRISKEKLIEVCNESSFNIYDTSKWYRDQQSK